MFLASEPYVFFSGHQNCWWQNTATLGVLHLCEMTVSSWPFHWWVKHTQGPSCLSCYPSFLEDELQSTDKSSPLLNQATGQQRLDQSSLAHVTELLTGIVWLPCKALMAAWASACEEYFTNAHPGRGKRRKGRKVAWVPWKSTWLSILSSKLANKDACRGSITSKRASGYSLPNTSHQQPETLLRQSCIQNPHTACNGLWQTQT